jgi:hypothetical protein
MTRARSFGNGSAIESYLGRFRFLPRWHLHPDDEPRLVDRQTARAALEACRGDWNLGRIEEMDRALRGFQFSDTKRRQQDALAEVLQAVRDGRLVAVKEAPSAPPVGPEPQWTDLKSPDEPGRDPQHSVSPTTFDELFVLAQQNGRPFAKVRYEIIRADGGFLRGLTDDLGHTLLHKSEATEDMTVRILYKGSR